MKPRSHNRVYALKHYALGVLDGKSMSLQTPLFNICQRLPTAQNKLQVLLASHWEN